MTKTITVISLWLIIGLNVLLSNGNDSSERHKEFTNLKNIATQIWYTADTDPIRLSDLPESGLYLLVVKDCDKLIDQLNARPDDLLKIISYGNNMVRSVRQISSSPLKIRVLENKKVNIRYHYFSGEY
ncbi:MAG: hypothetical protein H8E14_15465 [Candidatus Marinimicrobia bacterium]|nr:hypothetical protein [Candidatus Neomarinimicrobiota bacterium]